MALNLYQYTPSAEKYGTIAAPVTPQEDNQQGIIGDMTDSATAGLFDSVGGVLDLVGAKGFAKDFYGWAEDNRQEMSDEGRAAIGKSIIEKNDAGEWSFGEGASDLDTWLLGFANMAGQFATSVVPGAGAGALAAKAGLAATGVNAARIAGYAAGGGSAATGQAMEQGRQEVLAMPDDVLMKSERFADAVRQTYKPDMTDDEAFDTAKSFLADQVAQDIRTDPKVLLANYGASAIGDPIIGRALAGARIAKGALRSAGKGFVTEGATEAVQAGTTQYGVNEALQPIDGRDAMDGVAVAAANEGIMGGVFGGVAGGAGGLLNRKQPEPVRDPDADAIRDKNPDLASAFDGMAQSAAQREADLQSIIGGMPAISQPALEGELLGPDEPASQNYNPNQIGMQARIGGPTIPRISQKDIIFAADGRTEAERNPAMEGEWLSPEQRAANAAAGFIENAPIDLESEQVKQAKADMERMRNQPRQITDKNVIFAGDGRPQQAAQEYVDNLQRQANQAASVPRPPQKDIIFAGDQSGVRVKGNGEVYKSPREAVTSKQARAMKRSGTPVEAVQFGDGWGWRVKEVQPEPQVEQVQQPGVQAAPEQQLAPVQMKKSGDPFKSEKEMKISASYKAAAATGAELETVPVDGGFGFRVKSATETAPAADLSGAPINDEWTSFADDSGTLKIPRAEMPQIKAEHRGAMTQFLKARGIEHEQDAVPAAELKPTQAEFSPSKVAKAMGFEGGDRSILVSSDGYVLDGHHQWLAKRERGEQVDIIRFDAPIQELVKQAHEFPSSTVDAKSPQIARPTIQGRPTGKQSVATTPAGRDIDVEYKVVEADSLVTSNLEDGRSNPDFPAELQPRDRSRAASQDQINRIAGAVNPRLLAESATTSDGAPIISADGIVESGNGRSLGLRKAYRQGGAEGYRQFLTDSGFDIEGMKQPVLVRVRRTDLSPEDRLAYIKESNQRTTLEMSATEQAASDAAKMSGVVADYQGGEITSAENRSFVRKFMQNVAGEAERGGLMDSSGVLSQNGRRRIEAALLSAAYGDDGIVAEVFESGDTDIKAIGGALLDAAGKWAQMRNAERDGMIADGMDVTPFLLEAVNLIRRARGEGKALIELVSTDDVFSGSLPDATRAWLSIFYRGDTLSRARGRDKVAEYLIGYANEALKTQPGDGLFGDVVTSDQVMGALNERITNQEGSGAQQGGLFTTGNADNGEAGPGTSREGQGSSAERTNGPDREQPEKPAVAAEPTTKTPASAGVSVSGPVERIDDFGEKLGGARKDVWGGFSEAVSSELDTRELPLSKSFPEPDYVKMAADGVSMETLAIIAAMRSEIPAKPRVSYKVRRWAEKVDVLRNFARDLIGGELTPEQVIAAMSKGGGELQAIADAIPAIAQANPETIKLAAKYRIGSGTFSIFRGKQYSPSKTFYYPQNGRSEMLDLASQDKQGALDNLVKLIKVEAAANPDTAGQKQSKISIYSDRYTKQAYLGWAGGSGVLRIQNFDTVNEAREYLKSNRADVEAKLKQLKQVPEMRRPENRKRVGPPRYAGSITPAIFADTFGFRGVEFGNWVEQGKRQKDLNEAYDALMDLADVLGVPPKALALNGELGMAFGARGKGAATTIKAAAHYEPSYVAINLTKESGSGSLAHEWWHAVDNYFARLSGNPNSFVTEGGNIRGGDMRQEVRDAFTSLIQAIRKTKMFQRAATLDSRRSKAYWSSEIEASARSFETFIIAELEAKGFSNDYLANVVDPDVWGAIESAEQTYPYPTKSEQDIINPAFRSFFDTLQTKETDKGVMLFSKQNAIKAKPARGVNAKLAKQFITGIMQRLNGAAGIKVVVLESQAEAEKLWQMSLAGDLVRGAYNRATNTAYVIAENIKSIDELREVVAHEVIGHGGLQNVISKADYKTFIERLKQTRNNRSFAEQWAQIDNDYEGFSENDKAEELFAYFVQNKPVTGPVKLWFNALKRWLHKALVSVGLAKAGDPDIEAMQDMLESIRAGFMFSRREVDSNAVFEAKNDITQTAAFKSWFGDSKVVDEQGRPLRMYHGTTRDFDAFRSSSSTNGLIFFTDQPEIANHYASDGGAGYATLHIAEKLAGFKSMKQRYPQHYEGGHLKVDLDISPSVLSDILYDLDIADDAMILKIESGDADSINDGISMHNAMYDSIASGGVVMPVYLQAKRPAGSKSNPISWRDAEKKGAQAYKAEGFDSVYVTEQGGVALAVFEPTQIKSATGNNGDFDPTNPDIRFSKSRTTEQTDALAGAVSDLVGRKRLDPDDPYAVENRRLKEQDKTLWEKAKQVFMRNFAPGGMLPRSIFDAKITRDGELESGEMTIKHLIFALERAVQKDTGQNVDNQSDEFINLMADALAGKVDDKLGNETKAALVAMRQYIDALSGDYLSVIQAKIDELTEQIKQDDKYTDKVKALNEIELYEKIKGNMGVYVNRSYRAFDDPKWFQKVPVDVINRAREYLIRQYKAGGDTDADARANAEVTLESILKEDTAYSSMESFIAESKLGAKDLSTLIARKDISPEIRELLGEYKDPRMNFAKTATKMARLVWNSRFLSKIKADGMGVFFFEKDNRPPGANTPIAGENSKTYEPLNGLYTFPEVAQALQDSLGTEKMEDWYEAAVKLTSMVKYGKTVLSPTTAMRNWQSAMFFAVANGHFDFKHMKKSLAAFREQVSQSATGDDLAYLKKLKKLGVVYDAPYAGEMMQLLSDSKIDEWLEGRKGKVFGTARQINNLAQGFYSFGDDFWKIIGYENEKANFISAGLSETEAEKMAAERIRNTYPTYSMVGRAIKKLARFPLMGTFVSFPAEIIRTTANMLRYAAQDMKSDNPKIRAMARKRLTGMALVSGMFYALSAMTAAMQGVDDEEEEAIRDVGPSWQKNSTFLFYGRDDKGKLQYFDISFLDPYGYFKRPITALLRDQPWEDAAASGAADMLSPFFGADITAGTFFQVFANKKQSGGQVYNEYADGTDQLVSIADHIWTGLRPGFVNNAMGIFNAAAGNRREGSGKEYDLGDEMMALMGWRASSLDAPTALYYRSFDFADQLQAANSTLNKVLRSDNSVDDDDIADAKEEAQRQYDDAFKQMQRIVQSGRNAGMTKEQVYRTLKLSGVSSRNISGLVNGNIPPMQAATLQTQVKAVAKAREIRGDEQASEVLRRFQIARQLQ